MSAPAAPDADRLLTAGDVARLTGVSIDTIRRAADTGRVPAVRTPGGHRRYRLTDVEHVLRPAADR